jgi:hypothetical protein
MGSMTRGADIYLLVWGIGVHILLSTSHKLHSTHLTELSAEKEGKLK